MFRLFLDRDSPSVRDVLKIFAVLALTVLLGCLITMRTLPGIWAPPAVLTHSAHVAVVRTSQ